MSPRMAVSRSISSSVWVQLAFSECFIHSHGPQGVGARGRTVNNWLFSLKCKQTTVNFAHFIKNKHRKYLVPLSIKKHLIPPVFYDRMALYVYLTAECSWVLLLTRAFLHASLAFRQTIVCALKHNALLLRKLKKCIEQQIFRPHFLSHPSFYSWL